MRSTGIFLWKEAPFIRLFLPFLTGIIFQYYYSLPGLVHGLLAIACIIGLAGLSFQPIAVQFRMRIIPGVLLHLLLFATGALLTSYKTTSPPPSIEDTWQTGDA